MSDSQPPPIYGSTKPGLPERFGERLRKMWESHEYVRIMNIDDEAFYWQALAPQDESYEIDRGPTKIMHRRPPRQYKIESGESMPLEGWNAYLAVEQLYKKVIAKKSGVKGQQQTDEKGKPRERIMNWEDPAGWDLFLPRIFMGKEVPTFNGQLGVAPVESIESPMLATLSADDAIARSAEVKSGLGNDLVPQQATNTVGDLAKELGVELPA